MTAPDGVTLCAVPRALSEEREASPKAFESSSPVTPSLKRLAGSGGVPVSSTISDDKRSTLDASSSLALFLGGGPALPQTPRTAGAELEEVASLMEGRRLPDVPTAASLASLSARGMEPQFIQALSLAWANKEVETFVCILGEEDVVYDVYVAAAAIDIRPTTKAFRCFAFHFRYPDFFDDTSNLLTTTICSTFKRTY
ncbi:unnamed protein product [Boreogadus saida]